MIFFQFFFICVITENNYDEYKDNCFSISGYNEITQNEVIGKVDILNLIEVIIGNGITVIGNSAFFKCTNLINVTLLESVKIIKEKAFRECSSLKYVTLNEGLESIEDYGFASTSIDKIVFPSTVINIATDSLLWGTYTISSIIVHPNNIIFTNDENNQFLLSKNKTIAYKCVTVPSSLILPSYVEVLWICFSNGLKITEFQFLSDSKIVSIQDGAFRQCKIIKISFPEGLKELHESIFDQSTTISVINLPSTLEVVSSQAFSNSNSITEINVAPGSKYLKTVEGVLYYNNTKIFFIPPNLTTIEFSKETDSIGSTSIQYSNLKYISIENGCEKYISYEGILYSNNTTPFNDLLACPRLLEVVKIHKDCQSIGYRAFHTCQIVSVEFEGDSVIKFSNQAFLACNNLKSINKFPQSLSFIGSYCLDSCSSLYDIPKLPPSLTTMDSYSFASTGIVSVDFSQCNGLTAINNNAFYGSALSKIIFGDTLESLGAECFSKCKNLKSVIFGRSLKSIGSNAFAECSSLSEVTFECENLTEIRDGAFSGTGLIRVEVPDSVSSILQRAFGNCKQLKEVVFGDLSNMKKVSDSTFEGSGVERLQLGRNIETLTKSSIAGASELREIEVSKLNRNITGWKGVVYTYNCSSILVCGLGVCETELLNKATEVNEEAFMGCEKLKRIEIGEDSLLETIRVKSFSGCIGLLSFEVPAFLRSIGESAFEGCTALRNFTAHGDVALVDLGKRSFFGCVSLDFVELGDVMESISENAFEGCSSLLSARLPSSMTFIGKSVFKKSGMVQATFCGTKVFSDTTVFEDCQMRLVFVPTEYSGSLFCGVDAVRALDGHCCFSTFIFSPGNWSVSVIECLMAEIAISE